MSELPPSEGRSFRAFLSYSHRDKAWAAWLHKSLETYRVPSRLVGTKNPHGVIPRRLNPVFRDRDELSSSPELGTKIHAALTQSENLIVICSPASAASRWVNQEVLAYKRMGRGERIFCLIVDGEPGATDMPDRTAEECFCPALRYQLDANGQPTSDRTEPIAADARPGKDGKANAKLKLIAGMLDVGFDALKQREQQRRVRRLTAIASLAVAVMAVTIVLAAVALVSRHRALIAEQQARVAQQAAQRRQRQAENLVNFMLGDLKTKLMQVDRLDIMQAVDDKAMAYFKSLPQTDVNDAALAERAHALEQIGMVRTNNLDLRGALQAFRASAAISSRLAAAAPRDIARHVAYSRTLTWMGFVFQHQHKPDAAEQVYTKAQHALQAVVQVAPSDFEVLRQLAYVENNSGAVMLSDGRFAEAGVEFDDFMKAARTLVAAQPHNMASGQIIVRAHHNLAELAMLNGHVATALAQYRAEAASGAATIERVPHDDNIQEFAAMADEDYSGALLAIGDTGQAAQRAKTAKNIIQQLAAINPSTWQVRLASASENLAKAQRAHGDLADAAASDTWSLNVLGPATRKAPTDRDLAKDYASALSERAAEWIAADKPAAARENAQKALQVLSPAGKDPPHDHGTLLAFLRAELLLAQVTADAPSATDLRLDVLATARAQTTGQMDPRLLALETEALLGLHRSAQAQSVIKQLWNDGYREPELLAALQRAHIAYPGNPAFQARLKAAIARVAQSDAAPQNVAKGHS